MAERADLGPWIDLAGRAISENEDLFPIERIAELLSVTFHAEGVSFSWASGGQAGARTWSPTVTQAEQDAFLRSGALRHDPLMAWFEKTRQSAPQSSSRVPAHFGTMAFREWGELLRRKGICDRLSMPVRLASGMHVAFVLAASDRPFIEVDLGIAARLQPLLAGLLDQAESLWECADIKDTADLGLTVRELSVLRLLADGLTAAAIARRLGIAERTTHKHLENLYRKLAVHDRVTAVLYAQRTGLLESYGRSRTGRLGPGDSERDRFLARIAPAVSALPAE